MPGLNEPTAWHALGDQQLTELRLGKKPSGVAVVCIDQVVPFQISASRPLLERRSLMPTATHAAKYGQDTE